MEENALKRSTDLQQSYQYNMYKPAATNTTGGEDNSLAYIANTTKIVTQKINLNQSIDNQDKVQMASPRSPQNQYSLQ